jgi:hypothetical protein
VVRGVQRRERGRATIRRSGRVVLGYWYVLRATGRVGERGTCGEEGDEEFIKIECMAHVHDLWCPW